MTAPAETPAYSPFLDDVQAFEQAVLAQGQVTPEHYDDEYFAADWREGGNRYELETRRRIEDRNPALIREVFEPARVLVWTADRLDLGFPSQFEANKEMAEGKIEALRGVLGTEFALQPKISIKLIEDTEAQNARSVLEATREKTHAERTKREAEAREHPITKHVLQTFGGHIKEIKTDV